MSRRLLLGGTGALAAASLLAAVSAYLYQLVGGRVLGATEFAPVGVLWTIQFLGATIIHFPIEQTITRRLVLGGSYRSFGETAHLVSMTLGGALVVAVFVTLSVDTLFGSETVFIVLAPVVVLVDGLMAAAKGVLAGRRRFHAYATAIGAESLVRLLIGLALIAWSQTAAAFGAAIAFGPLAALLVRPFRPVAPKNEQVEVGPIEDSPARDRPSADQAKLFGGLVWAAAAAQVLLASAPIVVGLLGSNPATISVVFVTVTLFRGPLSVSYPLLSRVLVRFTESATSQPLRMVTLVRSIGLWSLPVAGLAGLSAFLLGAPIVALLFGEGFRPEPGFAASVAGAVIVIGAAQFAGQAFVAFGDTVRLSAAWTGGVLVAVATVVVASSWSVVRAAGVAMVLGGAAALLLVVLLISRSLPANR